MSLTVFKDITEVTVTRFADSPLGKMTEGKSFDKPISEYDSPLGEFFTRTRSLNEEEQAHYKEKLGLTDVELDKCVIKDGEFRRQLNEEERGKLKEGGMSDNNLDNCSVDEDGKVHLKTINEVKEGKTGEDGVSYERKTIIINGVEVEGVFPKFDSKFDAQLPENLLKATDPKQEEACNKQLKDAVKSDFKLAGQFTNEELEQIKNGDTPDGYTWHHNEETGKMELVKTDDHQNNRHTGGKSIWSGGKENR